MSKFSTIPLTERMMMIAKIHHNMWYDESRLDLIVKILQDWDNKPVRNATYFNTQNNEDETNQIQGIHSLSA